MMHYQRVSYREKYGDNDASQTSLRMVSDGSSTSLVAVNDRTDSFPHDFARLLAALSITPHLSTCSHLRKTVIKL